MSDTFKFAFAAPHDPTYTFTDINGPLAPDGTWVFGINNDGTMVGSAAAQAYVLENGVFTT